MFPCEIRLSASCAVERQGENLKQIKDFVLEKCARRGQNLAVAALFETNSLDGGKRETAVYPPRNFLGCAQPE
jgi:hypothetical protein